MPKPMTGRRTRQAHVRYAAELLYTVTNSATQGNWWSAVSYGHTREDSPKWFVESDGAGHPEWSNLAIDPAPVVSDVGHGQDYQAGCNARYIALMGPSIARALIDQLLLTADSDDGWLDRVRAELTPMERIAAAIAGDFEKWSGGDWG